MRVARALSSRVALGATTALLLTAAACSSAGSSVDGLAQGITRDSVVTVLAGGAPPVDGSVPKLVDRSEFLHEGILYEVMYYAPGAPEGATAADVAQRDVTPIVLTNGVLAGQGWEYMNMIAGQTKAALPEFRAGR